MRSAAASLRRPVLGVRPSDRGNGCGRKNLPANARRQRIHRQPVKILKLTIEKKREEPFVSATLDELRSTVTLRTTLGTLKIRLEPDWAPNHARNFLKLASTGWYNGVGFSLLSTGVLA